LTLNYAKFKKLLSIAYRHEGSHEGNFILLIENRLVFMLYRMQFCLNIFDLRCFVENTGALVNGERFTYCNLPVAFGSIVRLDTKWTKITYYYLYRRMIRNQFYFNIPRYMFISYKLMFGLVYREPKLRDLVYPISHLDIYRACDYL
jgi:ribosomal protein S4